MSSVAETGQQYVVVLVEQTEAIILPDVGETLRRVLVLDYTSIARRWYSF